MGAWGAARDIALDQLLRAWRRARYSVGLLPGLLPTFSGPRGAVTRAPARYPITGRFAVRLDRRWRRDNEPLLHRRARNSASNASAGRTLPVWTLFHASARYASRADLSSASRASPSSSTPRFSVVPSGKRATSSTMTRPRDTLARIAMTLSVALDPSNKKIDPPGARTTMRYSRSPGYQPSLQKEIRGSRPRPPSDRCCG
jgi:hypothetical protein